MTSVALPLPAATTPTVVSSKETSSNAMELMAAAAAADPSSIESRLEKLNLKLLQNKLFQTNRHYFMRTSAHISLYSFSSTTSSSSSSSSSSCKPIISNTTTTTTSSLHRRHHHHHHSDDKSSSSSSSDSSSSSSSSIKSTNKAKKAVRFADALGLELVTIWCMNNHPVKARRLASHEDSEDSSGGSSLDDEDAPSSNDEDDFSTVMSKEVCHRGLYFTEDSYSSTPSSSSSSSHWSNSYHQHQSLLTTTTTTATISTQTSFESSSQSSNETSNSSSPRPESPSTTVNQPLHVSTATSSSPLSSPPLSPTTSLSLPILFSSPPLSPQQPDTFVCDNLFFTWHCLFEQPGISPDFYSRLNNNKVLLESIYSTHMRLNGIIRVLNLAFVKRVFIRYTLNNWQSFSDLECEHLTNSSGSEQDKRTDRFVFSICLDKSQVLSSIDDMSKLNRSGPALKLEFAVCFEAGETKTQYWDNNRGLNYQYNCTFKIASTGGNSSPPILQ